MKRVLFSIALFMSTLAYGQKAITNEVSADLRFGGGIMTSTVYRTSLLMRPISFPAITLYYTPSISKKLELQIGIGSDARGGRTDSPVAKYRGYNANGLLGLRYRMNGLKIGLGVNPTYFIDTRKTVLEGSLSSGVVHIPVRHFKRNDLPAYLSAEFVIHEKISLEARCFASTDLVFHKNNPGYGAISVTANYLLAQRYKRVRIDKK